MMITISKMVEAQSDMDTLEDKSKSPKVLEEVIITGKNNLSNKQTKILSSLDSYLESNAAINMIKRGAYAGEPFINGMATERSLITIDGMRIYGACTDKMDPITSYVEITNLSKANIQSGQSGAQHGATIAGSIDLVRKH
ncbi:MAG: TonB-dependent receptor plug domain-containing protein, partial [Chitinophagaceae bacterium]|nr:TonB-dependent receptor plug domain-containing protein [Chitinophagaceae bacterium]